MELYKINMTKEQSLNLARVFRDKIKKSVDLRNYGIYFNTSDGSIRIEYIKEIRKDDRLLNLLSNFMVDNKTTQTELQEIIYNWFKEISFLDRLRELQKPRKLMELKAMNLLTVSKRRNIIVVEIPISKDMDKQRINIFPLGLKFTLFRHEDIVYGVKEEYNQVPFNLSGMSSGKTPFKCIYETMDIKLGYQLNGSLSRESIEKDVSNIKKLLVSNGINNVPENILEMFLM